MLQAGRNFQQVQAEFWSEASGTQRRQHPVYHYPRLPKVVHRVTKRRELGARH